jgi:hypothetical protein
MTQHDGLLGRFSKSAGALHGLIRERRWARWTVNGLVVAAASVSLAGRAQTLHNPPVRALYTPPALLEPRDDINTIVATHLFGVAENGAAAGFLARSSLNLVVTGLLATGEAGGMVVLSVDGQPETSFAAGDDVMPGVRLYAVEAERIIIARGGILETVPLKEIEASGKASLKFASASDAVSGTTAAASQWAQAGAYAKLAADSSSQGSAGTPPVNPAPERMPKSGRHGKNGQASTAAGGSGTAVPQEGPTVPAGTNAASVEVPRPKAGTPVPKIPQPAPGAKVPEVPRPAAGAPVDGPPRPAR